MSWQHKGCETSEDDIMVMNIQSLVAEDSTSA
jgi:hypothetical protein